MAPDGLLLVGLGLGLGLPASTAAAGGGFVDPSVVNASSSHLGAVP
jgi:hypothetical protein